MARRNSRIPPDGLPLDEAAYQLAPRGLKMRAMNVQSKELRPIERTTDPSVALRQLADLSRIAIENRIAENEPITAMREYLLMRIRQHNFEINGIRINPLGRGEIEPIPPHFFDGRPKIIWHESILMNFGQRFERVRVCLPIHEQTLNPPLIPRPNRPSKGGRPETKSLLRPILQELMQTEQFRRMQRKSQFHHIRQRAHQAHPEIFVRPSQPSEDTMRAVMRDLGLIKTMT